MIHSRIIESNESIKAINPLKILQLLYHSTATVLLVRDVLTDVESRQNLTSLGRRLIGSKLAGKIQTVKNLEE